MAAMMARSGGMFLDKPRIQRNIHAAFPDLGTPAVDDLVRKIAANFGRLVAEIVHFDAYREATRGAVIEFAPHGGLRRDWQGPVIFVGAHVGGWELLPLALSREGRSVTAIYSRNKNAVVDSILQGMRPKTGAAYVEKAAGLKPCIQALKQGGAVAMLADQRVDSGLEVDFLGRPTVVTRFPARLAMKFGCPIVPFEVTRAGPSHLQVNFLDPIMPDAHAGAAAEVEMTQKMAMAIEGSITRNLDSWFCNKTRWKVPAR